MVGTIQSIEGLHRIKGQRMENLLLLLPGCLLELRHWSLALIRWDLHHWLPWFPDLFTGITALAFLGLQHADGSS